MRRAVLLLLQLPLLLVPALAGCLSTPEHGFARHFHHGVAEDPGLPGLQLEVWVQDQGDVLRVEALLRNQGDELYFIDGGCNSPWSSEIVLLVPYGAYGTGHVPSHPYPHEGCSTGEARDDPLHPGEERRFALDWNGTLWPGEGSEPFMDARPGAYEWTLYVPVMGPCAPLPCEGIHFLRERFVVVVP